MLYLSRLYINILFLKYYQLEFRFRHNLYLGKILLYILEIAKLFRQFRPF